MENDIHETVQEHAKRIAELHNNQQEMRSKQREHGQMIAANVESITRLENAMADLRDRFSTVATRDDIRELSGKIDTNVLALWKDAATLQRESLNALPHKAIAWISGAAVVIALIELIVHLLGH